MKIANSKDGIVCLPLVKHVPNPSAADWKQVNCKNCDTACWESDLARQAIYEGAVAVCTMCALEASMHYGEGEK